MHADTSRKLVRTRFYSPQSIGLPPLEEFQRLLDMVLESETETIKPADTLLVCLVRLVCFDTGSHMRRLTIVSCLDLLYDEVGKCVGLLNDVVRNWSSLCCKSRPIGACIYSILLKRESLIGCQ